MSAFPYDSIAAYQRWTIVSDAEDRAGLSPQGPAKFALARDAKIASAGSCFAQRIAERLPRYGMQYFIAEPKAAPYSARYGNVYSARQLQQLLERALGRFDPLERAWETRDGRFVDPFRPTVEPGGFASIEALEADRREHLAAVAQLFREVDAFVFTLGLTEIWSDARDGAVFPGCPGRGRGTYDPERHVYSNLDVAQTCAALEAFLESLARINQGARVILTVSPVAIAATMEPMHVVRASLLTKSILKVAAEHVARRHPNVDYFAAYDAVMANLGQERLFAPDGRHVIDAVADRTVALLVRSYVDAPEETRKPRPVLPGEDLDLADDCEEDRLFKLLVRDRSRGASNGTAPHEARIAHPVPIYVAGDSGSLTFRNSLYSVPGYGVPFIGCVLHTLALHASELTDPEGELNAALLSALLCANVLARDGAGSYRVMLDYDRTFQLAEDRFRFEPPLLLSCGSYDAPNVRSEFQQRAVALPAAVRPAAYRAPHVDDLAFDEAMALARPLFAPFERGLLLLRSYGFVNLAVHAVVPPGTEQGIFVPNSWYDISAAYASVIVTNAVMAEICARLDVPFVDLWSEVTGPDGLRDSRYTLDTAHLNDAASQLSVRRLLEALEGRARHA